MSIIYVSSAVSEKYFETINEKMVKQENLYGMPVAGNKFHNLVMKGLLANGYKVTSLSIRPFSRATNEKVFYEAFNEQGEAGLSYLYPSLINLPVVKNIWNGIAAFANIFRWRIRNRKEAILIYDASYVSILPFVICATKILKIKSVAIFMDIYNYMADVEVKNTNAGKSLQLARKIAKFSYNNTDKYVFLSEQMNRLINKKGKPYYVMEGIVDSKMKNESIDEDVVNNEKFVVMYAGALKKEYGLEMLVEAFYGMHEENTELWIFGAGDYSNTIKEYAALDERIIYKGTVSNKEIVKYEKMADLLVNPRPSEQSFTQYSFPSKLMEYMSSGTATLTTKLPTIPKEYDLYMYYIEKEDSEGLRDSFEKIVRMGKEEVSARGKCAKKYVLDNKNERVQAMNIVKGLYNVQ